MIDRDGNSIGVGDILFSASGLKVEVKDITDGVGSFKVVYSPPDFDFGPFVKPDRLIRLSGFDLGRSSWVLAKRFSDRVYLSKGN